MYIDSHCHLHLLADWPTATDIALPTVVAAARTAGVVRQLCVATSLTELPALAEIAATYADIDISIGVHPTEAEGEVITEAALGQAVQQLRLSNSLVAIGETGLDFYREPYDQTLQIERFRAHIAVAKAEQLPLIIHTRQARLETIEVLRQEQADQVGGVLHCFTEDWSMAKAALNLGFYISLSGIITFKAAQELQEVARRLPLDRVLIETDSPYLAPVPYRGKMNQPAYVAAVAARLAELQGTTVERVAQITSQNYYRLFGGGGELA